MKINQISVFLENKKGRLYEVCSLLGRNKVNIRALNVAESEGYGLLRMVVDDPQLATKVLKDNSFTAERTEIIAVEVEDRPGGLSDILKVLYENDVNVEYMYGFVEKSSNNALMVFRFEDNDKALKTLTDHNIKVVNSDQIVNL